MFTNLRSVNRSVAAGRLTRFWGYVSHDPKDHEKTNQKTKDLRPSFVSQLHHPLSQGSGQPPFLQQRLTAFYQVLHILSRNLPCPTRTENEDRVLTHAVTHEQKNRDGNNGESVSAGVEILRQTRFILPKSRRRPSYRIFTRMRPLVRVQ